MKTPPPECRASGVLVEFVNPAGHTVGQALFPGWQGKPLPEIGDTFGCDTQLGASDRAGALRGHVVSRHFDVQREGDQTVVWVRLRVCTPQGAKTSVARPRQSFRFSTN